MNRGMDELRETEGMNLLLLQSLISETPPVCKSLLRG